MRRHGRSLPDGTDERATALRRERSVRSTVEE
jgi:hypothetical protein